MKAPPSPSVVKKRKAQEVSFEVELSDVCLTSTFCLRVAEALPFIENKQLVNMSGPTPKGDILGIQANEYSRRISSQFQEFNKTKDIVYELGDKTSSDIKLLHTLTLQELLYVAPLEVLSFNVEVNVYSKRYFGPLIGNTLKITEHLKIAINQQKLALSGTFTASKQPSLIVKSIRSLATISTNLEHLEDFTL